MVMAESSTPMRDPKTRAVSAAPSVRPTVNYPGCQNHYGHSRARRRKHIIKYTRAGICVYVYTYIARAYKRVRCRSIPLFWISHLEPPLPDRSSVRYSTRVDFSERLVHRKHRGGRTNPRNGGSIGNNA